MLIGRNRYGRYCVPESSKERFTAQAILAGEVHEPDTIAAIIEHASGGAVVHAGTYFGDFLPALDVAGLEVLAFEPNRENWLHAVGTLHLNGITTAHVTCAALGERAGRAKIATKTLVNGELWHLGGQSYIADEGDYDCDVRTLDSQLPWPSKIAVIHLDVERYEERALRGALDTIERHSPVLILETVPEELVASLGYEKIGEAHGNTILSR